jgi:SnoaL-like domain
MKSFFSLIAAALTPTRFAVPQAPAGSRSTEQVLSRHNQAMFLRDLEQIMEDYADEAVLIDPRGVAKGKAAIRQGFAGLLSNPHIVLAPPDKQVVEGELAYLVWSPEPGKPGREAAETLIVRGGKIVAQTVAAFGPPPGPQK